ncbi:MAG: hypothetical protein KGL39_52000 [Patescibacteria group bacterium]|nr:hypothetical protein [Patescibacteria group bacterium]
MPNESRKPPAFQFYPGDWRRDTGLQACSLIARGLWHEMLCIMHDGEPYGHLAISGRPITEAQLARMVGESPRAVGRAIAELESGGVFSRSSEGAIYSRRMVRDDRLRRARAEGGQMGARHGVRGGRPRSSDTEPTKPLYGQEGVSEKPLKGDMEGVIKKPLEVEQKNPPASASAVCSLQLGESSTNTQGVVAKPLPAAEHTAAEAAVPPRKRTQKPKPEADPAALAAWSKACGWLREWLTPDTGFRHGTPNLPPRIERAVGSVGASRMLEAISGNTRELGFVRREFLLAWDAFCGAPGDADGAEAQAPSTGPAAANSAAAGGAL